MPSVAWDRIFRFRRQFQTAMINDPLLRRVSLSLDVQHFVTQDKVGAYLMQRAVDSRVAALEELVTVDATQAEQVRELQWKARIPDMFLQWLDEAVADGTSAEEQIQLEENY